MEPVITVAESRTAAAEIIRLGKVHQIDQERLQGDDWALQAQCIDMLERAIAALRLMRSNSDHCVDADVDSYTLMEV